MVALKTQRGFTLIELLMVIAIIGILSSIVIVSLSSARTQARLSKSLAQLSSVHTAVESYYGYYGSYPVSSGWQGYCSAYGTSLGDNWIPELQSAGLSNGILPTDPRQPGGGASCGDNTAQYIYYSNGSDYKLISHIPETMTGVPTNLIDPVRPSWAFGYWTSGAIGW